MHILCIALRCNKLENHYLLCSFNKTSASVLFLGFRYFELQNMYKRIPNCIRIPIFSVSSFIDSGAGLVLSIIPYSGFLLLVFNFRAETKRRKYQPLKYSASKINYFKNKILVIACTVMLSCQFYLI